MNWYWEDTWSSLGVALVIGLVITAGVALYMPHNVDYYYISGGSAQHPGICANAHWTWHQDEVAFCSDDQGKVLDFMTKANAALPKH